VRNAGGGGGGIRTLEQATYLSTNTVFAQVSLAVGPEKIVETAHKLGIESPLNPVLSIALGSQSVSPLEMASAYSTIANFGERIDSYLIERIENAQGDVIYQHEVERERVLDEALAAAVVRTLQKVTTQGTASGVQGELGRPVAGKTGTAQNYRDVWFMGFIPQYTTAVWVGYPDAQVEMVNFTVYNERAGREQYIARAYGGTVAAPVWTDFMLWVTQDLPVEDFPPDPEGIGAYYRTPTTEVPDVLGMTEEEAKDAIYKAGLRAEIQQVPSTEPEGTIIGQEPAGGTSISQGQAVTVLVSTGVPPEMPSFINQPIDQFEELLAAFNEESALNLTWVREDVPVEDPTSWDRIVGTDPPPGGLIQPEQQITVRVGVPMPEPPTTTTTTTTTTTLPPEP
jgi:membrane peptidoglycan carboxypeptidase